MKSPFGKYQGLFFKSNEHKIVEDNITIEKALQISVNDSNFSVVMQTPGDEVYLATGLLFTEDIIKPSTNVKFETKFSSDGYIEEVNCLLPIHEIGEGYKNSRSLLSVSSCGICGKKDLKGLKVSGQKLESLLLESEFIFALKHKMQASQSIFPYTGSTHGSALFNEDGILLSSKEDIGRHNSLDKAIGNLLNTKQLNEAKILFFSGRISFEIVFKCFRAKIPTIIAISAPSSLAIDFAKEFGIALYGFCRDDRFTRYA
jgi:FdhD protein